MAIAHGRGEWTVPEDARERSLEPSSGRLPRARLEDRAGPTADNRCTTKAVPICAPSGRTHPPAERPGPQRSPDGCGVCGVVGTSGSAPVASGGSGLKDCASGASTRPGSPGWRRAGSGCSRGICQSSRPRQIRIVDHEYSCCHQGCHPPSVLSSSLPRPLPTSTRPFLLPGCPLRRRKAASSALLVRQLRGPPCPPSGHSAESAVAPGVRSPALARPQTPTAPRLLGSELLFVL